jgi:RNA polymerase sigma factor (sigma-70 family)
VTKSVPREPELEPELELETDDALFRAFVEDQASRLRRALVAANGVQLGNDVCADALAWAWEHRTRVLAMEHPVAYLFRVGQSSARRHRRWRREIQFPSEAKDDDTSASGSPVLDDALRRLNQRQRAVVMLVHAHGYSYAEVADTLGVSVAAVRNQLHRGMNLLREEMGAS